MRNGITRKVRWITLGAMPLILVGLVLAADKPNQRQNRRTTRVGPEVALEGLTIDQISMARAELHQQLTAERPAKTGDNTVRVTLTKQDQIDMRQPWESGKPLRIGVVKPVANVSVDGMSKAALDRAGNTQLGVREVTGDGGFVWALTVQSAGAQAIRLHFTNFSLPDGVALYFYSDNGQAFGPYEGVGRNGTGDFWTRSIAADSGTIQLRFRGEPTEADLASISFVLSEVGHIGNRPPMPGPQSHTDWPNCGPSGDPNADCVEDANCHNLQVVADAKLAVAKMEWTRGPFINTCSGGLIADTDGSTERPLFLTANHCLSKSQSNMETFFFYTTDSCGGACPDSLVNNGGSIPSAHTIGFTSLASSADGDFSLGELGQSPPAGSVYLGWNSSVIAFTNNAELYRISYPNFGPQAYSNHRVNIDLGQCGTVPRGEMIYSDDITGATMGGSSGSPVLNANSEIVGQLFGCCGLDCGSVCSGAPTNSTIDGALAHYFANVESILDPQGGGGCTSDAECDDGDACNGAETCDTGTGSCQNGTAPACQNGDGCCPAGCDSGNDDDCTTCTLGQVGDSCVDDAECCSNKCKGRAGNKSCK